MKKFITIPLFVLALFISAATVNAQQSKPEKLYQQALYEMEALGNFAKAIDLFSRVANEFPKEKALAAKALLHVGMCYEKLGKSEAQKAYERVIKDFSDQREVAAAARTRLAALTQPGLTVPASAVLSRRITDDPMVDALGTPSSDGRFLSTTDWGTGDVALIDVATGQKRRVTNKGEWTQSGEFSLFPVLSPDGKRIAYSWWNKASRFDLRVINSDGTSPRVLYSSEEITESWPTDWTPDGNSILVFIDRADRADRTGQIALLSATDGSVRVLKKLPSGRVSYKASISPDGRYVAYCYPAKENLAENDVFLLPIEGGPEVPLVQHAADDFSPLWAPDGKSVIFVSDRTGSLSLWRIRIAGGKPQGSEELLRAEVGNIYPIGFSAKGSFFYSLSAGMVDVYLATLDFSTGKVTTPPAPISHRYAGGRYGPQWSPDGKSLVYGSHRGPYSPMVGVHTLSIFSPETGQERELPLNLNRIMVSRWSPDAREILVRAYDPQGRHGLYRVDARTGEATPLMIAEVGADLRWGRWSPDGKSVLFVRYDSKKQVNTLVQRSLQTGEEKVLGRYAMPEYLAGFDISPDGQQYLLYFFDQPTRGGTIKLFPIGGGQPRDLYQTKPDRSPMGVNPRWTPDGKNILLMHYPGLPSDPQPAPPELWRVSVETGKAEKMGLDMRRSGQLTVHPDGKRVAFVSGESKSEIWVMENLLPKDEKAQK